MYLRLNSQYLSLSPFTSSKLPELTVITGKNGSGKSQLLSAISNNHGPNPARQDKILVSIFSDDDHPVNYVVKLNGIEMPAIGNNIKNEHKGYAHQIKFKYGYPRIDVLLNYIIDNDLLAESKNFDRNDVLSKDGFYLDAIRDLSKYFSLINSDDITISKSVSVEEEKLVLAEFITDENIDLVKKRNQIQNLTGQDRERYFKMSERLFPENVRSNGDLFTAKIEFLFNAYLKRYFYNSLYNLHNNLGFEELKLTVSNEDFLIANRPPWELINEILNDNGLDFRFSEYKVTDYDLEEPVKIEIIKKSINSKIAADSLSSGEKIILGLILRLFVVDFYSGKLRRPDLILLDEPDANLHPEMVYLMINVLQNSFIKKLNTKVILTTHSPTTVAFITDYPIFELKNGKNTSLMPVEKDDALKILTGFLPTLNIDYKNHRQILVESPTDVKYYQTIYEVHKIKTLNNVGHQLYFISGDYGRSSSAQVIKLVNDLRNAGHRTCYGIVDRDTNNKDKDYVFVHGGNERYSIESFLFDPIYIVTYLISRRYFNIHSDLKLHETFAEQKVGDEPENKLQEFVDYFFQKLGKSIPDYKTLGEIVPVSYLNGITLQVPAKYLNENGHDGLLPKIQKAFPIIGDDGDIHKLNGQFINLIAQCYPMVPCASIQIIERLMGDPI